MSILARLLATTVFLAVAAFCGFGFLATYEPPGSPVLRLAYAAVGIGCLAAAGWIAMRRGKT